MPDQSSAGVRFRQAIAAEKPLQIVGTINAYFAILAEKAGHKAINLSGAGLLTPRSGCRIWGYAIERPKTVTTPMFDELAANGGR